MITSMLAVVDRMREKTGMSYQAICNAVRLPYPSLERWRAREKANAPLGRQPWPPKVKPPDFNKLTQDIAALSHGQARTQGTGALYATYRSSVFRRELQRMIETARHDEKTLHRQNLRRIQ